MASMSNVDGSSTEARAIARSAAPLTVHDVRDALRNAAIGSGGAVIVHSSLSRLGWVVGGAQTIVAALVDSLGVGGTIVMPAHTGISDPANWAHPPVPETWWPTIRDTWPAFDPVITPLRGMGAVVDCFRRLPGVRHSGHPATGFVALGPLAVAIVATHPLEHSFGDASPLGRLYDVDARVVLIGVGHGNNTSLHLAEHRADHPKQMKTEGAPLMIDGARRWVTYTDLEHDDSDFVELADAFVAAGGHEQRSTLGLAEIVTCGVREIVDFATPWISAHRR